MKFKFKIQSYQTEAVENTVAVFSGQPSHTMATYRRDLGRKQQQEIRYEEDEAGYRNARMELDAQTLFRQIYRPGTHRQAYCHHCQKYFLHISLFVIT